MSTLYGNEPVALWNPETDIQEKLQLEQEEDEAIKTIEEGIVLEQLQNHSGYKILESYLLVTIEDFKYKLVAEQDERKFRRLQEAVKAYTNVLSFVEFKVQEGKALVQLRTPKAKE